MCAAAALAGTCPTVLVPSVVSSAAPGDVCIPDPFTTLTIDFFDDYSWRAFVAMIWPAAKGRRGIADEALAPGAPAPLVFETFKSLWEVFHADGSAPSADFNGYEAASQNACRASAGFGSTVLGAFNGYDDIGQAGIGELNGPLVAQNGRYVRYQTLYNKIAYDYIVSNRFYLRKNLPAVPSPRPALPVLQFPYGSIAIKAAWLDLKGFPAERRRRFYTRSAIVKDPNSGKCSTITVGLVGLHIVQKTASRPQWIWSSFEQTDSIPLFQGGVGKFTFNDGTPAPMPAENPIPLVPLPRQPAKPFNVLRSRNAPVHEKTALTNQRYHQLLGGTVWKYYDLVTTQWPLLTGNQAVPVPATQTGEIFFTFPGTGPGSSAASAYANVTMETFDQKRPELGCMSCHNQARLGADFLWSVLDHAWPPTLAAADSAKR
jgi:hypothetical protein